MYGWSYLQQRGRPERGDALLQTGEFSVHLDLVDDEAVVRVEGDVDVATAPEMRSIATALCEQRHLQVVFDLAAMTFIDAAGLRVIAETANRVAACGGRLVVRSPAPHVMRLFDLCDLTAIVDVPGRVAAT